MMDEKYSRKAPTHFGIKHEPLIVTAVASNKKMGQVVAFIEKQLCFFEHDGYIPTVGEKVEVMITRPIHPKFGPEDSIPSLMGERDVDLSGFPNRSKLTAVLIRPVEPDKHQLMAINGFECSGTMFRTLTSAIPTDGSRPIPNEEAWKQKRSPISLTPGRCGIIVANNANAGFTWKVSYKELTPTNVYVDKRVMEEKGTLFYISGITRVEDCEYKNLFRHHVNK